MCDLLEEPEACADYFAAIADWKCRYFHKIATYYKVDGINAHDDYGSAHNLFMPLDLWRSLIKPNLAKMVDQVHKDGLLYQHHSCGHVEPLFDDLVEIGVDAIDTLQGGSNPHLPELKKRYGDKITFCGGFDNQYVLDLTGCRRLWKSILDMAWDFMQIRHTGSTRITAGGLAAKREILLTALLRPERLLFK